MGQEQKKKVVRAKLYNMKSSIEGLISLVESEAIPPDMAIDALCTTAAKIAKDCSSSNGDDSP